MTVADLEITSLVIDEDLKAVKQVTKVTELQTAVQDMWLCALKGGEQFFSGRMGFETFMEMICDMGLIRRGHLEAQDRKAFRQRFEAIASPVAHVDFSSFLRVMLHVAMYRHDTTQRLPALKVMMQHYGRPYVARVKVENMHDGCVPSEQLTTLLQPDGFGMIYILDRVFYKYDAVIGNLFRHYRAAYDHRQNKDGLRDEALQAMRGTIEVEDLRCLVVDLGVFPNEIQTLDLCRLLSYCQFGREPQLRRPATVSPDLDQASAEDAKDGPKDLQPSSTTAPVWFTALSVTPQVREAQFGEVLFRLAQMLYRHDREYPTVTCRLEKLLREMEPLYLSNFGAPMSAHWRTEDVAIPIVREIKPAVIQADGPRHTVAITGEGFCTVRGAYVQFNAGARTGLVKAVVQSATHINVAVPRFELQDVRVDIAQEDGLFAVALVPFTALTVTASNDRRHFSAEAPPVLLLVEAAQPSFVLPDDLVNDLSALFTQLCTSGDIVGGGAMPQEQWDEFLASQNIQLPPPVQSHLHFDHLATVTVTKRDKTTVKGLPFEGFLHLLLQVFAHQSQSDPASIVARLEQLVQGPGDEAEGLPTQMTGEEEEQEMKDARALIKLVQKGTFRMLDVYCGPVLCGSVQERPGLITTLGPSSFRGKHKFLTYLQHDLNTESRILSHVSLADSFDHLLHRLLLDGFDLAASCDPKTRKPTGRCWTIHMLREKIGAVWDYPGQMTNLDWQPSHVECASDTITMTVYRPDDDLHFVVCYVCFTKAKDISHLRSLLVSRGYTLRTELYQF